MYDKYIIFCLLIFFTTFFISKISYKLNLVDLPNRRKRHLKSTAYTGGISISLSFLIALKIFDINISELNLFITFGFLISIIGFVDDKYSLNTGGKLCLQILPIYYLIVQKQIFLSTLGSYGNLSLTLGSFAIPFTLLCVLFLINAFNYFDGIDGLLSFSTLSVLTILYFLSSNNVVNFFIIIISYCIIIFLIFNFAILGLPKLFLGDNGSLLLGFLISFILIYFALKNITPPILLAWSVSIFVYEFISVNLDRFFKKKEIFKPGLDHLHNFIFKKTKSLFLTNFYIVNLNFIFFIIGYLSFYYLNSIISLILFIIIFFIFFIIRKKIS